MKSQITPICHNNDFRRIYNRGKSFVTPVVVVYVLKNREKKTRIGITTSKKIGNAVKRNRSRRIIREAWREISPYLQSGNDYIFVARGKTPYVKMQQVKKQLETSLKKAGLYNKETKPV
ncbi:ribonuclease P protein component [Scatolibacter rhodanostii]|uniref:ribonuclease P protein component n=1 Tax=Scatolibacter rhodanostii TaxID=2014781 RepID=UPI000C070445|nr:ribonuclease P protein component [Scatolibacter rhodanostii]